MSLAEPARHALYNRLGEVLGTEHADALMTHISLASLDEIATKSDVAAVKSDVAAVKSDVAHLRLDFDRLETRFDRLELKLDGMQRFYVTTVVSSMLALTTIFSFVVALIR